MWTATFSKNRQALSKTGMITYINGADQFSEAFEIQGDMTDADIADKAQRKIDWLNNQETVFENLTEGKITPALKPISTPPVPTQDELDKQDYQKKLNTLANLQKLVDAKVIETTDKQYTDALTAVKTVYKPEFATADSIKL